MKRLISLVLCCVTCLFAVPVPSFAVSDDPTFWLDENNVMNMGDFDFSKASASQINYLKSWLKSPNSLLLRMNWEGYSDTRYTFVSFDSYPPNVVVNLVDGDYKFMSFSKSSAVFGSEFSYQYYHSDSNVIISLSSGLGYGGVHQKVLRYSEIVYAGSNFKQYCTNPNLIIHDNLGVLGAPSISKHNLTINYQYEDGTVASSSYTHSFPVGDSYNIVSPTIDGFAPDVDTVSGTMAESDITVTVTYHKDTSDPVLYDLTIDYLYGNGLPASVTYNAQFPEGEIYDVPSPLISGYTPDRSRVVGVMPDEDVTELVVYTEDKPPPIDPPVDPPVDPTLPDVDPEYVAFHLPALYESFVTIRANTGNIFSVCLWCFLIILAVRLIPHIVGDIGQ